MARARILTVEDDPNIADLLRLDLSDAGFDVLHAENGMKGLLLARTEHPDLLLLDLGLPDFGGEDVLARLRKSSKVPVIVLTARDALAEKVRLLERGADDYLVKPFHSEELIARIRVQLRQLQQWPDEALMVGPLKLEAGKYLASYMGKELRLTHKELELLGALMRQPGRVMSREELGELVWAGHLPEGGNVVDVHMANLRAKLRDVGGHQMLRSVRGVGYGLQSL